MRHSRRFRLGTLLAFAVAATVIVASAANAGKSFHETFHDEETTTEENFCGVPGLTVEFTRVTDGRVHIVPRGRDGLGYFSVHIKGTDFATANGKTVTSTFTVTDKDLKVTDNGDGTLTLLVLTTGNAVLYGPDGKAIARNPGQTRFEILVDHAGTPTDPSDDEFVKFLGVVKESTGRNDDFCEAAVPVLTSP